MIEYKKIVGEPDKPAKLQLAENSNPYLFLTERHMQAMWLEQKYFKNLTTDQNCSIKVLSPGIWNAEAGPDFLKAHLIIGNQELRGDVELHLSEESWYHHLHHQDSRYDNVILHISFWKPAKTRPVLTSHAKLIPRAFLHEHLTIPESRLLKLIDLDLYPYQHFVGSGRCASQLFCSLSNEKTTLLLRSAASWRLEQKHQFLQEKLGYSGNCMIGGMAMALGYRHNAESFLEAYHQLNSLKSNDEHTLLAYSLGISGFFDDFFNRKWSKSSYYQALKITFEKHFHVQTCLPMRLDKIRPANHPVRRFALLAKIMTDPMISQLESTMNILWEEAWPNTKKNQWQQLLKKLIHCLPCYNDPYWEYHYTFEKDPHTNSIALMGENLKKEILLNVYLPILYDRILRRNHSKELAAFELFYTSIPASKTKKGAYLSHRFFGDTRKKGVLSKADVQQGAYQIHRDFCIHYEASCIGCPFVEKVKSVSGKS